MINIFIIIVIIRITVLMIEPINNWYKKLWTKIKLAFKSSSAYGPFSKSFIDVKALYFREFKILPCVSCITKVDGGKIYKLIQTKKFGKIKVTYQYNHYNWLQEKTEFSETIVQLPNRIIVELGPDWADIYYSPTCYSEANELMQAFKNLPTPQKEVAHEINIISLNNGDLDLKTLEIKPTELDINLYYNDDFKEIDATIKDRLSKEKDKGIVLLHGLPGTGKTTYLRHLIGSLKKRVMFVSPSIAGNLMNPEFMDLLIDNPNTVLIIEDAENIIMDRKFSTESSVSNLLNISDGLLSDCLNVQIICTFNSAITMVDSALMRKGRLIARYEFGKLDIVKAQALSNHLGIDQVIEKPMTLAEITNPTEKEYEETDKIEVQGFRRKEIVMN
jgi:hypothetical protein